MPRLASRPQRTALTSECSSSTRSLRRAWWSLFTQVVVLIHPSAWNRNSQKFAVASIRRRQGVRASGWGYAGFLSTIVDTLDASVARNRGKRAQVVAFQLPENFRNSLSHATGFATFSVLPPERLRHRSGVNTRTHTSWSLV